MTPEQAIVILQTMAGDWMETAMPEYLDEFCDQNGINREDLTKVLQWLPTDIRSA